jgi:DNA-binding response OmpR family regulator
MHEKILLVDDDPNIRRLVEGALSEEQFDPETCGSGEEALELLDENEYALIILDIMLPDLNGKELFRKIRDRVATPIIFLSSRSEDIDRIVGLELGADDYITKPFNPRELIARIRAVLRRTGQGREDPKDVSELEKEDVISQGLLQIFPSERRVEFDGQQLELTKKQFDLLTVLAQRPGKVFSRSELIDRAYDNSIVSDATIDSHMRRIRAELDEYADNGDEIIETVRGVGFTLNLEER